VHLTQIIDESYRSVTVGSFTYDLQPIFTLQKVFDGLPGQRLIFDDQRTD